MPQNHPKPCVSIHVNDLTLDDLRGIPILGHLQIDFAGTIKFQVWGSVEYDPGAMKACYNFNMFKSGC